ncbi:MAG: cobalamin biosynthesis protein, partial [Pseudomonadota bacterium]
MFAAIMALALAIDALIGWPEALYRRIGHPVTWIGALIDRLEARWNNGTSGHRRVWGAACMGLVVCAAALSALGVQIFLPEGVLGIVIGAILAWPWLAARSLHDHVARVAQPLDAGDLPGARAAVAMIVGR